ncbi:MAG: phage holin family protein [Vicinamibacterales bacterium]
MSLRGSAVGRPRAGPFYRPAEAAVIDDARELFRQEAQLARAEIKQEIDNAKSAAITLGIAAGALAVGGLFILIALGRAASDLFGLPVRAGFGIVGLLFAIVGGIALALARAHMQQVKPMPERTVRTLRENARWLKRQTS